MRKQTLSGALAIVLIAGVGWYVRVKNSGPVKALPHAPLALSIPVPLPDMLGSQAASLIAEAEMGASALPAPDHPPAQDPADVPQEIPSAPLAREAVSPEDLQRQKDEEALLDHCSQFAYIQFGGEVDGRSVALFIDTVNKEQKSVAEGSTIYSLHVDKVEPERVLLSYGKAEPMAKPRVDLEVKTTPDQELSEEERKARLVRYQELWGNRLQAASKQFMRETGKNPLRRPSAEEERKARREYMKTLAPFFRKVRAGDPTVDPRDVPILNEDIDENMRKYFESYALDQTECTTGAEAPPASGNPQ
jgi:hypothetical protein